MADEWIHATSLRADVLIRSIRIAAERRQPPRISHCDNWHREERVLFGTRLRHYLVQRTGLVIRPMFARSG